ncbi:MAG TPA: hypothetical protein VHY37_13440 [Tepidisphaeraceae bacterium]|nr:hypothetical protein [Tepidisphaeraceae bacterium]
MHIEPHPGTLVWVRGKYIHWQDGVMFVGYLEEYPDYWTQGGSLDELKENLADLFRDIASGELPGIRKVDELVIS